MGKTILSMLLLAALSLRTVSAARILALMVVPSHSHHFWNSKYIEALAERGHHVTYFSVDKYVNMPKNVTQILIENVYETFFPPDINFTALNQVGNYESNTLLQEYSEGETQYIITTKGFQELKRVISSEKFDLVVHDFGTCWFLLGAVDVLGRPPVIGITAYGIPTLALTVLGNPLSFASKPHFYAPYSNSMSYIQRADNYFLNLWSVIVDWMFMKKQNDHMKAAFGPNVRSLDDILDDINIILVNSNHAIDFPFPAVPGLIPVGGLNIKPPKPLPQDLKTFLDGAKHGVIYFSLGSNVKSTTLHQEKIRILIEAFRQLSPVQVLWKWESDTLPGKPPNVRINKWLPQTDILAHPNVRLFFTHSGMLSTHEALYHGKPIVGMPILLDQHINVRKCVERRLGEKLELETLSMKDVVATLKKVLEEPEYTENARRASAVFRDEMATPLERAVYWTEYAIRHKGAPHLRYAGRDLSWYQNCMLDVLAVVIGGVSLALFCVFKAVSAVGSCLRGGRTEVKMKRQ